MYKTNEYYVDEILNNINFILDHMKGETKESLKLNEVLTDSMVFRLIQISELAKNLTDDYKQIHEEISWGDINALRNRLVHDYGNVTIVYETLTTDIAVLKEQLSALI